MRTSSAISTTLSLSEFAFIILTFIFSILLLTHLIALQHIKWTEGRRRRASDASKNQEPLALFKVEVSYRNNDHDDFAIAFLQSVGSMSKKEATKAVMQVEQRTEEDGSENDEDFAKRVWREYASGSGVKGTKV